MPEQHHIVAADAAGITRAAGFLRDGRLAAFPTETVYGLGADATDDQAVAAIFAAKDRPSFNPLIVHTPDITAARKLAQFAPDSEKLAARFWPGALTLVLPRRPDCGLSDLVSAGLDTVAIRVPAHALARDLLNQCGRPIAAPSANRSGEVSPTTAGHVAQSLPPPDAGGPAIILDGGPCAVGVESTVVDLATKVPAILRHGGVTKEDLEAVIGPFTESANDDTAPKSPGMLSRHYAPQTPLRLNATEIRAGEALLGFGPSDLPAHLSLSPSGNLQEAAANLFSMLRQLDTQGFQTIAVMPVSDAGLGRAINDRLRRAAYDGADE